MDGKLPPQCGMELVIYGEFLYNLPLTAVASMEWFTDVKSVNWFTAVESVEWFTEVESMERLTVSMLNNRKEDTQATGLGTVLKNLGKHTGYRLTCFEIMLGRYFRARGLDIFQSLLRVPPQRALLDNIHVFKAYAWC